MIRRYRRLMLKITLFVFCLVVVLITVRGVQAQYVCPDGSSVASGPCTLCPNGRYIGGGASCQLAPGGTFGPRPDSGLRLSPDGTFVPSGGSRTLCPDGTYVMGGCVLGPNGRYIGG
jgi:hypothetical protein